MASEAFIHAGFNVMNTRGRSTSRRGKNAQLPLADLLRQSVFSRVAGYEDTTGAERLSQAPTFRLVGSEKIWARGAAVKGNRNGQRRKGRSGVWEVA
jgi:hypothetical protein